MMTSGRKQIFKDKIPNEILNSLRVSVSGKRLVRQTSQELPPLVGAPTNNTTNRYATGAPAAPPLHGAIPSTSGTHPSPARSRRKLKIGTNMKLFINSDKNDASHSLSFNNITPPSPPVTPRRLSELSECPSPILLQRCRQRSCVSLDGSPVLRRRIDEISQYSYGRPATPSASPRMSRSFSLCGNINEISERKELSDELQEELSRSRAGYFRADESVHSASDPSDESPSSMMKAMSGLLQVVTEENTEEEVHTANRYCRPPILDNETGEILRHPSSPSAVVQETNLPIVLDYISDDDGGGGGDDDDDDGDDVDGDDDDDLANEDEEEQGLPEYQKSPLSSERKIAAWLNGLDSPRSRDELVSGNTTFPSIGNR
ncbi:hypothetical protein BSL78_01149 [Apostichopus japonicus]|uniref:Uncharacterized protein n=1 Tax=Stichopus japonicus TaxID=307972 RepID=A0A2G8LNW2_STIJA|nr:hypothetical protein BSL78_01149 [Apostichopus japonicus]